MWKDQFDEQLSLLGHRNWILIVDKAYPLQSAAGIITINTKENPIDVLVTVLGSIENEKHTRPIIYIDKELDYMHEALCPGVKNLKKNLKGTLNGYPVKSILHDEIFAKLDKASKLFNVLVLKTENLIPYTSIFMELDCGYWSKQKEESLRDMMSITSFR